MRATAPVLYFDCESSRSQQVESPGAMLLRRRRRIKPVLPLTLIDLIHLFFAFLTEADVESRRVLHFSFLPNSFHSEILFQKMLGTGNVRDCEIKVV